jgi:hypothetical protein
VNKNKLSPKEDEMKNHIDFYLRNLFRFSKKGFCEKNESKIDLFGSKNQEKEEKFIKRYLLESFKENSSRQNYIENLYFLELLEDYLRPKRRPTMKVLDLGSKNWSYAKAEHSFFRKFTQKLTLDGIELDAYRVYSDFYSRYDAAKYYSKGLKGANYITGNFMEHMGKYDFIIWILPFVSQFPHSKWGLPKKFFKPKEMLEKAFNDLKDDGIMLIVNQGKDEYEIQKQLFDELEIPYMPCGEFKSSFLSYENKRFVSIVTRSGELHL